METVFPNQEDSDRLLKTSKDSTSVRSLDSLGGLLHSGGGPPFSSPES